MRRLTPWIAVWGLTLALTAVSTDQSLRRYRDFQSGWPWDLAYNNQWLWSMIYGDQKLTVRPINSWGDEGPSIWSRTHLDPIRLAVAPFYPLRPGPEALIIAQNVILWWVLPAAFGLLLAESRSVPLALSGTALVPMTPLLWPMLWNDFREMELALPFVLWAIQGFRSRHRGLSAIGIVGMLASREEFGIMLATFALLPPRDEEDIGTTYAWARTAVYLGVGWFLFGFLGFQHVMVAHDAPDRYLAQFGGEKPGLVEIGEVALDLLIFGLGPWAILAGLAPRASMLALPWLWGITQGRLSIALLGDWRWGAVRYASPMVALVLAAGLIGYARLGTRLLGDRRGRWVLAGLWLAAAMGFWGANREIAGRMDRITWPIAQQEAAEIRRWIDRVGPDEGVIACYEVSAPLSSRRRIYSNRLSTSSPRGYPDHLRPEIRWTFLRKHDLLPKILTDQGFRLVFEGDFLAIYRRDDVGPRP
jgi:hypothetical protein